MAKLTLEDLRRMRGEKQKEMEMRDASNKDVQVIVGMGTCGIAAGAKDTFTALDRRGGRAGNARRDLRQR